MEFLTRRLLLFTALILSAPFTTFAGTITGEVIAITDGDTITVRDENKQHKIRLNGIDAPELAQPFGQESKLNLSDLLFNKQVVVAWKSTDLYDRIIGTVTIGSVDAGLE